MKMHQMRTRGGHRSADSFRPSAVARAGFTRVSAHSTSWLATPTKEQLREELAQAARNTAAQKAGESAE